jgi:hypothetical protein
MNDNVLYHSLLGLASGDAFGQSPPTIRPGAGRYPFPRLGRDTAKC